MKIKDNHFLSEMVPTDKPALVEFLNDYEVSRWTLSIPHPYTEVHAENWIQFTDSQKKRDGRPMHWAIRQEDGKLIGAIGFAHFDLKNHCHRAEIGYWIAKPHWGKGLATSALNRITDYAVNDIGLVRIQATTYSENLASQKVLEKSDYQCEGLLRKYYFRDGKYIDAKLYSAIVENV